MDNDQTEVLAQQADPAAEEQRQPAANAETLFIPKQRPPSTATPRADGWEAAPAVGSAPVDGAGNSKVKGLTTLAWLLPTLIMAAMGLVRVTWPNLSGAELATWAAANSPLSQLWQSRGEADLAVLPYHLLIRLLSGLVGTSDLALRAPSLLAMTAATAMTALLASRLAGPRVGLLAGLLFVAVPTTSLYAQTASAEALTVFAALLSTLALVRLLDRPRVGGLLGYALATAVLTLAYVGTVLLVVAQLVLVVAMRPRLTGRWIVAALLGIAPAVALAVLVAPDWLRRPTLGPAGLAPLDVLAATLFGVALIAGVALGLGLFSLSLKKPAVVFSTWAVVPLLGLYLAARFTPYEAPQLLVHTLPAWACLAALTLGRAPVFRGLVACLAVALLGLNVQGHVRSSTGHGWASAELAAQVTAAFEPGDVLVYGPTVQDGQAARDLVARYVPADRRPEDVLAVRAPRSGGSAYPQECDDVAKCIGNAPRIWVIRSTGGEATAGFPAAKSEVIQARYLPQQRWEFRGLSLHLLTLKPTDQLRPPPR